MPIKCQFHLSRTSAVYYTGEQVTGSLTIRITKKPLQVEGISITLLGLSTTSWNEAAICLPQIEHNDGSGPTEPIELQYTATKTHIEQTQQLSESLILPSGSFEMGNFLFQIPCDVPGSCRLDHGSINYFLQLTLERRSKHSKRFQQRLRIRNRIELHELRPASISSSTLCLSLPRTVFVPGQRIAYRLEPVTPSGQFTTRLCQCTSYGSQLPLAKLKSVVRVMDESYKLEDELHLPLTAPIMSSGSAEPIEIAYYIETLSNYSEPLRLPLFIGTVAPPVHNSASCSSLGFVNFGLSENDAMIPSNNQHLPHRFSREIVTSSCGKHSEQLKLLRHQKKHSYVRLVLRYLHKHLIPTN